MRRIVAAVLVTACVLSAKSKRVDKKPELQPPAQYGVSQAEAAGTAERLSDWWSIFNDATLTALIERALQSNLDLRLAAQRIAETRGTLRIRNSDLLPQLNGSLAAQRLRGGIAQGVTRTPAGSAPNRTTVLQAFETGIFSGALDVSWELDLFGGIRADVRAARADLLALEENRRDVQVILAGEIGRNYAALRGAQRQLAIAQENVKTQAETVRLTEVRYQAGLATDFDVARAAAQLGSTEAEIPAIEVVIEQSTRRLAVLLGATPSSLKSELSQTAPVPTSAQQLPAGLPGELLRRRPDLRRAEAEIVAANERYRSARADLFPTFTITGQMGRQGTSVSGLSLGAGNFYSVGPTVRLPIFTGGRIRGNIAASDARTDQAITRYEQLILTSVEEVENAMTGADREDARRRTLVGAVGNARRAVDLSNELYLRGLSDFLSVLEAQQQLFALQTELANAETNTFAQLVALYKALGGGWRP